MLSRTWFAQGKHSVTWNCAGGVSTKTSYNAIKLEFEYDSSISLYIYAFSETIYHQLIDNEVPTTNDIIRNPRVFISYTATDVANRNWVKSFACKLREMVSMLA